MRYTEPVKRVLLPALAVLALAGCDYETIASNLPPAAAPEAVTIRPDGTLAVSDALAGRVLTVDPDTGVVDVLATLPLGQCAPNPFPPILGALDTDHVGNVYVNANTCDPADRGVYKVEPDGTATLHVPLGPDVLANGLTIANDTIFIVDTFSDRLWSAPLAGGGASIFVTSPLFLPSGDVFDPTPGQPGDEVPLPGGNGLERYDGQNLVLANSSTGDLVLVPLDGSAPTVLDTVSPGCDDIAVDLKGQVLCTTDAFQTVIAVKPGHGQKIILDAADGDPLDGPTDVTCKGKRCYVSNAAFPFFPSTGNGPSIGTFKWYLPAH